MASTLEHYEQTQRSIESPVDGGLRPQHALLSISCQQPRCLSSQASVLHFPGKHTLSSYFDLPRGVFKKDVQNSTAFILSRFLCSRLLFSWSLFSRLLFSR